MFVEPRVMDECKSGRGGHYIFERWQNYTLESRIRISAMQSLYEQTKAFESFTLGTKKHTLL